MTLLAAQFEGFHRDNPQVYEYFKKIALGIKQTGRFKRYSINAVFERVRWHFNFETVSEDGFKLNNNHRAFYARLLMKQEPLLTGFFEVREQKAA
jgi:hypothetical protein